MALPGKTWYYKGNHKNGLHMGPVAEDFAAAFDLGNNHKYIGTVVEEGVALAAIKGLNIKLQTANAALRKRIDKLAAALARLEQREEK